MCAYKINELKQNKKTNDIRHATALYESIIRCQKSAVQGGFYSVAEHLYAAEAALEHILYRTQGSTKKKDFMQKPSSDHTRKENKGVFHPTGVKRQYVKSC